jgi:hypothetical protein
LTIEDDQDARLVERPAPSVSTDSAFEVRWAREVV